MIPAGAKCLEILFHFFKDNITQVCSLFYYYIYVLLQNMSYVVTEIYIFCINMLAKCLSLGTT